MPADPQVLSSSIINYQDFAFIIRTGLVILASLYFIFSLVVLRQINLMTEILATAVSPVLRLLGILHSGLALGIIIIFMMLFFT